MGMCKILLLIFLAVFSSWIVMIMYLSILDHGRVTLDHKPGPCHLVEGVEWGSEDMDMIDEHHALITSGLRFTDHLLELFDYRKGQMFLFDFRSTEVARPVAITGDLNLGLFNPHGISIWKDNDGTKRVFVVNHPTDYSYEDTVDIFLWNPGQKSLVHERTVRDVTFRLLNDVAASGPSSFYVTNFQYYLSPVLRNLEMVSVVEWGSVVHYDGSEGRVMADGLAVPNGIYLSRDDSRVYVMSFRQYVLLNYRRNADNSLTMINEFPVHTALDNPWVDPETGDIWGGCHPIMHKLLENHMDPNVLSPSQVIRVKLKGDELEYVEEVFMDSGRADGLSGSSVAIRQNNSLLIGSVFHKLMYCQLNHIGL